MNFRQPRNAAAVLSAGLITLSALSTLSGCNTANQHPTPQASPSPTAAQVSIIAPATVTPSASGTLVLALTAQLHNPTNLPMQLFAGTPCAVFDWVVASADKIVQTEPNKFCAQVVARALLLPYETIQQQYEIVLDGAHYRSGNQYILRYQFWHHQGSHTFTLADVAESQ